MADPDPDAPAPRVAFVHAMRAWPLYPYVREVTGLHDRFGDRGCFLYPRAEDQRAKIFERHPETELPRRVARAGLGVVEALLAAYRGSFREMMKTWPEWDGTVTHGFHADAGVEVVRASFLEDGFTVRSWDAWAEARPPVFDERALDRFARDPRAWASPQGLPHGDERGEDRHGALRAALAARDVSPAWILAGSLLACPGWPSFRAWAMTRATRLDGTIERLAELPGRRFPRVIVRRLFEVLDDPLTGCLAARRQARAWLARRRHDPALRDVLADAAARL